ncbi:MAG: hypothetical protein U5K72_17835 [Balneolaceae bacterium]|nr:hypothetical protein [Balneolaceae bacterium]
MRYFFGCLAFLLVLAGCSGTESVQEEVERERPVEEESAIPAWYNDGVHSATDSLEIHGFSLSSAMDSVRAAELSTQTALENLRFEIDRTAEMVRTELADSEGAGQKYSSPEFIIRLRNTVSDLPLDAARITLQHESSSRGVHYFYAKASIFRTELPELFRKYLRDETFIQTIGPVSE